MNFWQSVCGYVQPLVLSTWNYLHLNVVFYNLIWLQTHQVVNKGLLGVGGRHVNIVTILLMTDKKIVSLELALNFI